MGCNARLILRFLMLTIGSCCLLFSLCYARKPWQQKNPIGLCRPLTTEESVIIVPVSPNSVFGKSSPLFTLILNPAQSGKLLLRKKHMEDKRLRIVLYPTFCNDGFVESAADTIILISEQISDRAVRLLSDVRPVQGNWILEIPEGLLEIEPDFVEVDSIDIPPQSLLALDISGAWYTKGEKWNGKPILTIHDDDGIDGFIPSSYPSEGLTTGYFSLLFPCLESLGLRGCVSLEGRRAGFINGQINDNFRILRRLQNEAGWEIQSHSMECLGERLNNWVVDDLNSQLAYEILRNGENKGTHNSATESVYSLSDGKQYLPLTDRSEWIEADSIHIRPYVGDYETREAILYNPYFSVDYHWGEWFRLARENDIKGESWVAHNTSSSHANVPLINKVCPNGFADMSESVINYPPLLSTACRMMLEGQTIRGYKGDDGDNKYNEKHYIYYKQKIDEAISSGGWLVMGLHAYRKCWQNSRPGALISEGGSYPDEWVSPMDGINPLTDPLTPPVRLGIKSWTEWYPCPGTRLRMIWDLMAYARDKGMINVTSSEGFKLIGNEVAIGYYNRGIRIGQDKIGLEDTKDYYPHYVVGKNGGVSYYNPLVSDRIVQEFTLDWHDLDLENSHSYCYDTNGRLMKSLPTSGIIIVRGSTKLKKIIY